MSEVLTDIDSTGFLWRENACVTRKVRKIVLSKDNEKIKKKTQD